MMLNGHSQGSARMLTWLAERPQGDQDAHTRFPVALPVWPTERDYSRALDTYARGWLSHHIDLTDVLIGECVVGLDVPLCTFNVRHFRAVAGLTTEQPYERV